MTKLSDRDDERPQAGLFEDLPPAGAAHIQQSQANAAPRLQQPNRLPVELRASALESLYPKIIEPGRCRATSRART
jgi:hypothetical protein